MRKQKPDGIYAKYVKRALDMILSAAGLAILSPLFAILAAVIYIDDPGPVIFKQKRVGKGCSFFYCHKFRSMRMDAPHDVPTHRFSNPDRYITKVGRVLRKTSLDELPQIWDIFVGNMSIIGPRPALWNQDDLVAEREKYGANGVMPGLTGWAQINGRDELEIPEKARMDGEYVKRLNRGGLKALVFDARCLAGTFFSVVGGRGVVEGGTGKLRKSKEAGMEEQGRTDARIVCCKERHPVKWQTERADVGNCKKEHSMNREARFANYGYLKHFDIDTSEKNKKRVLVTGANSYIGKSFEAWAKRNYPVNFTIDTLDMQNPNWQEKDFSSYDTVFHVAGIAHVDIGKVSEKKKKYYAVNTDLAIETAQKAKKEGVKQFVFMSSIIIYGNSTSFGKEKIIDEYTLPAPANFYGDSKWQADRGVRRLADKAFHVAVLRPPMIYGRGCKGNYQALRKIAKKTPIFPKYRNKRSMLYIENLCEFVVRLSLSGEGGIYFPQNREYSNTSEMVRQIGEAVGCRVRLSRILNPVVGIVGGMPIKKIENLAEKAFGSLYYVQKLSVYNGLDYRKVSLEDSIWRTETGQTGD